MAKPDFRLNEPMHHLYTISLNIDIFCYINNNMIAFRVLPWSCWVCVDLHSIYNILPIKILKNSEFQNTSCPKNFGWKKSWTHTIIPIIKGKQFSQYHNASKQILNPKFSDGKYSGVYFPHHTYPSRDLKLSI